MSWNYRCEIIGCTNDYVYNFLCSMHRNKRLCKAKEFGIRCQNYPLKGGVCKYHGGTSFMKKCIEPGCTSLRRNNRRCYKHRLSPTKTIKNTMSICKVKNCNTKARVFGHCFKCANKESFICSTRGCKRSIKGWGVILCDKCFQKT